MGKNSGSGMSIPTLGGASAPAESPRTEPTNEELQAARIAHLEAELAKAQSGAKEIAQQVFGASDEIFVGKTEKGVDMWKKMIHIPPSGGTHIQLGELMYYHGRVYDVDTDTLRTIKEVEHRMWQQERIINGAANENAYRPQMNTTLSMKGRA